MEISRIHDVCISSVHIFITVKHWKKTNNLNVLTKDEVNYSASIYRLSYHKAIKNLSLQYRKGFQ